MRDLLIFIFILGILSQNEAATSGTVAGTTLARPYGSRAIAMGEAYSSISGDVESLQYNPAGLADIEGGDLILGFSKGFAEDRFANAALATKFQSGVVALAFGHYDAGEDEFLDLNGNFRTLKTQQDWVAQLGSGFQLQDGLVSVGISGKFLRTELGESESTTAIAGDAGIQFQLWKGHQWGFAFLNVGQDIKLRDQADPLPTVFQGGMSQAVFTRNQMSVVLALDVGRRLNEDQTFMAVGSEMNYGPLSLRLGTQADQQENQYMAGAGFRFKLIRLDYAFRLADELDDAHRVTLGYSFAH